MSKKPVTFREQMAIARPDVEERRKQNGLKGAIAMKLRALRDAQGMSQADVAQETGMTAEKIAEMESLVGTLPRIEDLERFLCVCGGYIEVVISSDTAHRPTEKS